MKRNEEIFLRNTMPAIFFGYDFDIDTIFSTKSSCQSDISVQYHIDIDI